MHLQFAASAAIALVSVAAYPASEKLTAFPRHPLARDDFNPDDLSFIKKLAAVGDSYSAGIGAGDRLGGIADWACSRYDHSYPNLINEDPRLGNKNNRNFEFHSCSGAVIKQVIEDQLPHVSSGQDVITLSAGGNDAELVNILNQCIFQWAAFDVNLMDQAVLKSLKSEPWASGIYWDNIGRGCEKQLQKSEAILKSIEFAQSLDSVISATKKKLSSSGTIYYTGYAKFFGTDLDPACDDVTWSIWSFKSAPTFFLKKQLLTRDSRKRMNELVDLANQKLAEAVARAGSQVEFVNYDEYVGIFGGRYCEPGVDESTVESNTRVGLMFYELNTLDPIGKNPWKRGTGEHLNGTFAADQNLLSKITQYVNHDARLAFEDYIEKQGSQASEAEMYANNMTALAMQNAISIPNILPDGYGRIFHPQILLHEIIANLVIWRISSRLEQQHGWEKAPEIDNTPATCPIDPGDNLVLRYKKLDAGKQVKKGTELRILPLGDSITVGFRSEPGDGDGYRRRLKDNLSNDKVVFAGTEKSGTMDDGYYAAWSGMKIQYMIDHIEASLKQRPNIVLVHAGTNDMNSDNYEGAADRLGKLIDLITSTCPDAVVLVAMIINTCNPTQSKFTKEFQKLIPGVVRQRSSAGYHVLAVDFTTYGADNLHNDCLHPSIDGYKVMGDYWYSFIEQIPSSWINEPVGNDPHDDGGGNNDDGAIDRNGGIDENIPAPDWGTSPIQVTSPETIKAAVLSAYPMGGQNGKCNSKPNWIGTGKIGRGVGANGDWKYHQNWQPAGMLALGLGLEKAHVRLHDMNGDGKADYVWVHPKTGAITCWINNLPQDWTPAGTSGGIIASGLGPADTIFIADMNGDGMEDYLIVDPDKGSVQVWWNYGADQGSYNGWKWVPGGEIASGVPHANLKTLRFPDINGDGRADYVYIGKDGSLFHYLNTGTVGGQDVGFDPQGGIATGATAEIWRLVFADLNGDGRDDYLLWDGNAGLTGFLNQRTNREGVPYWLAQGTTKLADGIGEEPASIRLADMDGDSKDDYVHVGDNGALTVWYNRGTTDDSMAIDGIRFVTLGVGQASDMVWLEPDTGAPIKYNNGMYYGKDQLGWSWDAWNDGKPIAHGAAPAKQVQFGDIDGDGYDDYVTLDPVTGALKAYLFVSNYGGPAEYGGVQYNYVGTLASGIGPGKNVRIADIDGDGRADYIYLSKTGGATVYRNVYGPNNVGGDPYSRLQAADAFGIGQRPEEISFHDINGDGKADYLWTRPLDGRVEAWLNVYPEQPPWKPLGKIAGGVGTSGANIRYGQLVHRGRADYIPIDPSTGAMAAWLGGCTDLDTSTKKYHVTVAHIEDSESNHAWGVYLHDEYNADPPKFCDVNAVTTQKISHWDPEMFLPTELDSFELNGTRCFFKGNYIFGGKLICDGASGIWCERLGSGSGKGPTCKSGTTIKQVMICEWS